MVDPDAERPALDAGSAGADGVGGAAAVVAHFEQRLRGRGLDHPPQGLDRTPVGDDHVGPGAAGEELQVPGADLGEGI